MRKILIFICIIATLCSTLVSCGVKEPSEGGGSVTPPATKTNEELIEERITSFLTAYNNGDMEATMACLTAKQRNAMQALLNLLESLTGSLAGVSVDLSDLFSLGVATGEDTYIQLKIKKIEIENSLSAIATATMNLDGEGEETIYFIMAYENGGWYIKDMTDKIEPTVDGLKIKDLSAFYRGTANIQFEMNGKTYSGIINTEGEIIYYCEKGSFSWLRSENGYGLVISDGDDNQKSYTWYNNEGEIIKTMTNDAFDEILSPWYNYDLMLVYKNTSTISKEEHSYGLLDYKGDWVKPLTAEPQLNGFYGLYMHIGGGIFVASSSNREFHYVYNSNTGQSYCLNHVFIHYESYFSQGVIYCQRTSKYGNDYPPYFAFYPDGTVEEVPAFTFAYNALLVNNRGEYMSIYDHESKTTHVYESFPKSMFNDIKFENDLALIILKGADGKKYFTVIDKECNQKFDPIVCQSAYINEDKIVYSIPSDSGEYIYEMIDANGNVIISKEQGYTYMSGFYHGITLVKKGDEGFYMDTNGNTVTIKLPKSK
ncbi:MAG: DUF1508 domain-containing protein [Clostridia bacterium]|nr:DUF1508 domain-containing protein [Clostridia bacterium]